MKSMIRKFKKSMTIILRAFAYDSNQSTIWCKDCTEKWSTGEFDTRKIKGSIKYLKKRREIRKLALEHEKECHLGG